MITEMYGSMRENGEKQCQGLICLTEEVGVFITVNQGTAPRKSSDQSYASTPTGDREDILGPVINFLNDNLQEIVLNMLTSEQTETQFSIPSSKGPGLLICLEWGKLEDFKDKECLPMADAIVGNEILHLLGKLEYAKTSRDNKAEQEYNRAIPHLFNKLSTIPLDLIGRVYEIEPAGPIYDAAS